MVRNPTYPTIEIRGQLIEALDSYGMFSMKQISQLFHQDIENYKIKPSSFFKQNAMKHLISSLEQSYIPADREKYVYKPMEKNTLACAKLALMYVQWVEERIKHEPQVPIQFSLNLEEKGIEEVPVNPPDDMLNEIQMLKARLAVLEGQVSEEEPISEVELQQTAIKTFPDGIPRATTETYLTSKGIRFTQRGTNEVTKKAKAYCELNNVGKPLEKKFIPLIALDVGIDFVLQHPKRVYNKRK